MAHYIIGDIHGCRDAFMRLLDTINFDPTADHLYLVGDLINRGPDSVGTMELILKLRHSITAVLGNHDLSFLCYENGSTPFKENETYDGLINSPRGEEIIHFMRHLPLIHAIEKKKIVIAHAGIPPQWRINEALAYSTEVEAVLQSDNDDYSYFMDHLFGNIPDHWDDALTGMDRLRTIVNYLTRMRLLYPDYRLDFEIKSATTGSHHRRPWFTYPRQDYDHAIVFGHWAALGLHEEANTFCIDSGAVWGNQLTALKIDHRPFEWISVPATS